MVKKIFTSAAFLGGGALFWFVLAAVHAFGAAEAGMSAGPVPRAPSADALIPWLVCSYFAISGIGVLFARNRRQLKVIAIFAYSALLITFCAICSEASGREIIGTIFGIGFLTVIAFLPWHVIWFSLLF